jgi:hypothetical protein
VPIHETNTIPSSTIWDGVPRNFEGVVVEYLVILHHALIHKYDKQETITGMTIYPLLLSLLLA